MTDVRLDAFGIARDGNDMATASHDLSTAWTSLQSVLSGSGGMAGPDEASKEWIDSYDSIAKQAGEASEGVATALAAFDSIMGATGQAYKRAELAGALQDSDGGISIPTHEVSLDTSVPTAMGEGWPGALGEFQGWVEEALASMGLHLPLADTDKMGTAVSAWKAYDDQLQSIKSSVAASLAVASSSDIPQWASMSSARSSVVTTLGQMSTAAGAAVEALDALIDQTVTARNEIMDIVKELAIAVGVEVGVSIALSFFTFGASAVVGAAATSATVMRFVVRIAEVIQRLITLSRIPREAIENGVRLFQAVGRGSRFARIAGETFKGMATGVVSQGFSNILVEGKSFSEGWQGALLGGAVGGTIGGGLGLVGRTGREAAATRSTFTHVAVSTGRGAVTGAASGVGGDYVTAKVNGQDFNVIQSLVFGTVGGAAFDGGHGAVEAHHVHAGGGSTGASSGHGSSDTGAATNIDVDTHVGDVDVEVDVTGVTSATDVDVAATTASGPAPTAHTDAPVVSGAAAHGSPTGAHAGDRPNVDGSQTPVVTGAAHAGGSTTHAGGENVVTNVDHVDTRAHDLSGGAHSDAAAHTDGPVRTEAAAHTGPPTTHADAPAAHADAPAARADTPGPQVDAPAHTETSVHAEHATHSDAPAHVDARDAQVDAPASHADAPVRTEGAAATSAPEHAGTSEVQGHSDAAHHEVATTASHQTGTTHEAATVRSDLDHAQAPTATDIHAAEAHVLGGSSPGTEHGRTPGTDQPSQAHDTSSGPARSSDAEHTTSAHSDASGPAEHVSPEHAAGAAAAGTAVASHPAVLRPEAHTSSATRPEAAADGTPAQTDGTPAQTDEAPASVTRPEAGEQSGENHGGGDDLRTRHITSYTRDEIDRLLTRNDLDRFIEPGEQVRKVMDPKDVRAVLSERFDDETLGVYDRTENGVRTSVQSSPYGPPVQSRGFHARSADSGDLAADRFRDALGLNYRGTPYSGTPDQPVFLLDQRVDTGSAPAFRSEDEPLQIAQDVASRHDDWDDLPATERGALLEQEYRDTGLYQTAEGAQPDGWRQHLDGRMTDALAPFPQNGAEATATTNPYRGNGWAGVDDWATREFTPRGTDGTPGTGLPYLRDGATITIRRVGEPDRVLAVFRRTSATSGEWQQVW
ncbi:hypothetical protein [Curtobacterium sp. 458]|uniref:hypothetical protein n=1 Tax=Curtobacterium sp. 458 TaxID=3050069 RepID=UPI0025B595DA|nr:hypothetical protein [Curtobacterium sp. 458]WJY01231.1 hypothetical protein QPJ90_05905 [Curtobacterium sp. 458]